MTSTASITFADMIGSCFRISKSAMHPTDAAIATMKGHSGGASIGTALRGDTPLACATASSMAASMNGVRSAAGSSEKESALERRSASL